MDFQILSMLDDERFYRRLAEEAKKIKEAEPSFEPVEGDLTHWRGTIMGGGVYKGGIFHVEIKIPREYPFEPPEVKFLTKIWHPNIKEGKVCMDILTKNWTPAETLVSVIESLRAILLFPNPDSPLNREAAREMIENPDEFKRKVKEYIEKYASEW